MLSLGELLKEKIELYGSQSDDVVLKRMSSEYQKEWAKAVQFFQIRINKDQKRDGKPEFSFMAVRQRIVALREIDDMRWFYKQCCVYAAKRDPKTGKRTNTFSKCFWGATKIKCNTTGGKSTPNGI